jgi:hypothetical protein
MSAQAIPPSLGGSAQEPCGCVTPYKERAMNQLIKVTNDGVRGG